MTKEEIKNIPSCPGIYKITNIINNKSYIGQSINLNDRLKRHLYLFKSGKEKKYLYSAMHKYGIENFKLEIIEIIDEELSLDDLLETLDTLEIYYIEKYKSLEQGYNETKGGERKLGLGTENVLAKLRAYYHTEEWKIVRRKFIKHTFGYNLKENFFVEADSRIELSTLLKNKGFNISSSQITACVLERYHSTNGFVFGNTKEECLNKLEYFKTDNAKHNKELAPNYQEYLEYLKTIVDKNGYLPKIEEIANHYNRARTTIIGWNKHISEYIKLDKKHNRLMLVGFSNSNIEYDIEEYNRKLSARSPKYNIFIIDKNENMIVSSTEGSEFFKIDISTFRKLVKRKNPYKGNYIVTKL